MTSKRFLWIAIGIASLQAVNVMNAMLIMQIQSAM